MTKVLFVYPNKEGYPIIPLAISVLSGVLKYHGHTVDLFDVTFLVSRHPDHEAREKTGQVLKVNVDKYWGESKKWDIGYEFRKKISEFRPDLIAFTIVENNYGCAKKMFKIAKETSNTPILVGGLFPTTKPDFFIEDANVDMICIGEGERAIEELAQKLDKKEDLTHIPNLIIKNNGQVIQNNFAPYYTWDPPILQDWEIFDTRHLLKPFMGKMCRTGFFELSRGCPFGCTYCNNKQNQKLFKELGGYNREKPINTAISEMQSLKTKYNLELIFFNDENFLTMRKERLDQFCKEYKEKVGLPFFIMTRADKLVNEDAIKLLKDTGCVTIGIGVEVGNEQMRMNLLNKKIPNSTYIKAFENCHKYQLRANANIMIGLPFETEENIKESISFCKVLKADAISLAIFAPYYGTKLRDICVENGFMEDRYYDNIAIINHSILNMPQISKERIEDLYYTFQKEVDSDE